jgi:hypothetical protein
MPHQFEKVLAILKAETADLRELAHLAGGDPRTFYRGISLSDVDTIGQNIEGMDFSDEPTKTRRVRKKKRNRDTNGLIDVLRSLDVKNLNDAEKAELKKKLSTHKKEFSRASKLIDRHLKQLATKKKRKVGKRKSA